MGIFIYDAKSSNQISQGHPKYQLKTWGQSEVWEGGGGVSGYNKKTITLCLADFGNEH